MMFVGTTTEYRARILDCLAWTGCVERNWCPPPRRQLRTTAGINSSTTFGTTIRTKGYGVMCFDRGEAIMKVHAIAAAIGIFALGGAAMAQPTSGSSGVGSTGSSGSSSGMSSGSSMGASGSATTPNNSSTTVHKSHKNKRGTTTGATSGMSSSGASGAGSYGSNTSGSAPNSSTSGSAPSSSSTGASGSSTTGSGPR